MNERADSCLSVPRAGGSCRRACRGSGAGSAGSLVPGSAGMQQRAYVVDITAGPDGALWVTDFLRDSRVGRITMTGRVSQYSKGLSGSSRPSDIVAGPDCTMRLVEADADRTGRVRF
jgi:streptogramin lyase